MTYLKIKIYEVNYLISYMSYNLANLDIVHMVVGCSFHREVGRSNPPCGYIGGVRGEGVPHVVILGANQLAQLGSGEG